MTEPAKPKNEELVEMEALDLEEWERDKHTPQAGGKLDELVKQTAATPPPMPPARKTQTIARTVTRPASEPNPFDGPTVRNAGAAIPAAKTGSASPPAPPRAQTPPAGVSSSVPRTQTPPAGTPAGSAPTSSTAPSAAPPPPRPQTGAQPPVRASTAPGTPVARITPTSMPAQQAPAAPPTGRTATARTSPLGVPTKPTTGAQPPQQRPPQPPAATIPTRTQTPAVGVGVTSGRPATPGATKTQALPAMTRAPEPPPRPPKPPPSTKATQAIPVTTRPPAPPARPPTPLPVATVPPADDKSAVPEMDTEGWALPDDDMAVPSEPLKVVAPKPKLDAMAAENWSLPDSIVEDPPLPPSVPAAAPPQDADESPFMANTTIGTLEEDLPIAIAPAAAIATPFVESKVEPASSPQIETDLVMTPPPRRNTPPPMQAVAPPPVENAPPPRAPTPLPLAAEPERPSQRAMTPPVGVEPRMPDVFETDESMSPEQQRAIKTAMFAVARPGGKSTKIIVGALGALVLGVVVFLAVGRGGDEPSTVATVEPTKEPTREPPQEPTPPTQTGSADDSATATGSGSTAPPDDPPPAVDPPPVDPPRPVDPPPTTTPTGRTPTGTVRPTGTGRPPTGTGRRTNRNNVTTTPTTTVETPAPSNDGGETAKAAYAAGNKALYAGDANGAIQHFQAALAAAPKFAAAQRGLGLAYSSLGNKPKAISAFKAYLAASPGAKDTAKIQERITALSQ